MSRHGSGTQIGVVYSIFTQQQEEVQNWVLQKTTSTLKTLGYCTNQSMDSWSFVLHIITGSSEPAAAETGVWRYDQ